MKEKSNILNAKKVKNPIIVFLNNNMGPFLGLVLLCILIQIATPKFMTGSNLSNVLKSNTVNALISCGMLLCILLGGIDISVGSIVGLSGVISAWLMTETGISAPIAFVLAILVGVLIGFINGICVSYLSVPAFIATLATQCVGRGFTQIISGGISIRVRNEEFQMIAKTDFGPVSIIIVYAVVCLAVTWIILNKTRIGYNLYAIGGNAQAAEFSGINVKKYTVFPYVFSGIVCAFCGILWTARLGSANATLGNSFELDAISAVVIGGTSMSGGIGTVGGTFLGIMIIAVLQNGLNLMGVNSFWQFVAKGIIILLAVIIDVLRKRKRED